MPVKIICLSYPIENKTPVYGNLPAPRIALYKPKTATSAKSYLINLCNHTSTHVDAPAHFMKGGKNISDFSPGELTFQRPFVTEIAKKAGEWIKQEDLEKAEIIKNTDCLLIKTGFGVLRRKKIYCTNNPGMSPEAIIWLRQKFRNIRCIGIDCISISAFSDRPRGRKAHLAAFVKQKNLGEPLLIIEDMNLSVLKKREKIRKILLIPWLIRKIDSAPCTVLAEVKTE